jgi:NAD(P)-dependent dehydrogenase (short-subunit alcohol dehydrogenase family)
MPVAFTLADEGSKTNESIHPETPIMREGNRRNLTLAAAGVGAALGLRALLRGQRSYDLRGKVVLITGGSRGLGLVLAREFARQGARLALCARDEEELERALDDLGARGILATGMVCDVSDPTQVQEMANGFLRYFGRIDVLVNNAGVIQVGPMEVMTLADYEEAMRVHYWGPLYATLAVLPQMKQRHEGRIVNITSIGGKVAVPHLLPYAGSKFALVGLSEGLRAELMKDGILVTTVVPGLMRTGSPRNAFFKGQHEAEYAWFKIGDSIPLFSTSAERAARRIVRACRHGDAELTLTLPAQLAVAFHGLFPGLTADILALVNRSLPAPGGIGTARARGQDSETPLSESWATELTQTAARANNELGV